MSCAVESSYGFRSRAQVVCNQCPTRAAKSESADSSVSLISLHRSAAEEVGVLTHYEGAPLSAYALHVGSNRRKGAPHGQGKVYCHGRTSGKHLRCGQGCSRKTGRRVHYRDEGCHHPRVHPGNTGKFVDHLRRRNQRCLVV